MDSNKSNQVVSSTSNSSNENTYSQADQNKPSKMLIKDIMELFVSWVGVFGSKMKTEDWDMARINLWAEALTDLEITPSEFKAARRKSMTLKWMPTAPADFIDLGRKPVMDSYPNVRQAYLDQANHRTDCPIAYETAKRVGFSFIREQPETASYPIWQKYYKEVCIEHSKGKEFTKPQVQQIERRKPVKEMPSAVADEYLASIRALLAGGDQ